MSVLAYARLVRLPNTFTAIGDIALGGVLAGTLLTQPLATVLLAVGSVCLYAAGMVWNDFFDRAEDARDRPFRPIPSGQVPASTAALLGVLLLAAGVLLATAAGWDGVALRPGPGLLAGGIVVAVLLYDAWLKHTLVGPISMAVCRFLNVLLGLSLADADAFPWAIRLHAAGVVAVYIVGVTWFAKQEATTSNRAVLRAAAVVMLLALLLALALPLHFPAATRPTAFPFLLVAFGFWVGLPVWVACQQPQPQPVQRAVKTAVLALLLLDAVLATASGQLPGLAIALLLVPAAWVGKWVYST